MAPLHGAVPARFAGVNEVADDAVFSAVDIRLTERFYRHVRAFVRADIVVGEGAKVYLTIAAVFFFIAGCALVVTADDAPHIVTVANSGTKTITVYTSEPVYAPNGVGPYDFNASNCLGEPTGQGTVSGLATTADSATNSFTVTFAVMMYKGDRLVYSSDAGKEIFAVNGNAMPIQGNRNGDGNIIRSPQECPVDEDDTTPPPATCTEQTVQWTVNGNTCSGSLTERNDGQSGTAANTASGYTGSATYACSAGNWTKQTGSTCSQVTAAPTPTSSSGGSGSKKSRRSRSGGKGGGEGYFREQTEPVSDGGMSTMTEVKAFCSSLVSAPIYPKTKEGIRVYIEILNICIAVL